jgi:hypothetical protein
MSLIDLNFALVCDTRFVEPGRALTAVGRHVRTHLLSRHYGAGVKFVGVGLVMRELGLSTQRHRKPEFNRKRRKSLLGHDLEDTLEFSVYPPLDSVRTATTVRGLIEALRVALARVTDEVRALNIPEFDTSRFLEDLDKQLNIVERSSLWADIEVARFVQPASSAVTTTKQ